jgi:signal transduction histidine kinase
MAVLVVSSLILSGAVIAFVSLRIVGRPLKQLVYHANSVGDGNLSISSDIKSHDEFAFLANAMNKMTGNLLGAWKKINQETNDRIALLEQLRNDDRLKTVGKLSSGVAHELGTPLNIIMGRAGMILADISLDNEAKANAKIIRDQVNRMSTIIQNLLSFARRQTAGKTTADMNALVSHTAKLLAPLAKKRGVTINLCLSSGQLKVHVATQQIGQVLTNLVSNAIDAMPSGGTISMITRRETKQVRNTQDPAVKEVICIQVKDEGVGISEQDIDYIFDPFYTTKEVGLGTGLGLSIAHGIVVDHGGWIEVSSIMGEGTRFDVYLQLENKA